MVLIQRGIVCKDKLQHWGIGLKMAEDVAFVKIGVQRVARIVLRSSCEMCSDCTFSGLPVCEHLSFREFCEAICRIAVILYPLDGMRAPDLDMAARTTFNSDERGSVTLQRLLPSFQRQSTSKASHQDRSMFHSRSVSAEPLLERSLPRSDFQSSISSTFSDAAAAIITPRSPTRSNGLPMPASWIQGKLTPISQVF